MNPKTTKINFAPTAIRINIPSAYVKALGLDETTKWRFKETPTAYLLRNEKDGRLETKRRMTVGGKYAVLAIFLPLSEVDRAKLAGTAMWEIVGNTAKAALPKVG